MLSLDQVKNAPKKGKKAKEIGLRVTSKTIAYVQQQGGRNACIAVRDLERLDPEYQGLIMVEVDGTSYPLRKGRDGHALWVTQQEGDTLESFVNLFNILSTTPDEYRGRVTETE